MNMKPAFVLGNGKSRLNFDLDLFKKHGKVYGCNALYRDFTPQVLVATDPDISKEIEDSNYPETNVFYTRKPIHPNSKLIIKHWGFSSGPAALKIAADDGYQFIYIVGFDLIGDEGKVNNVYAGTANYRSKDSKAVYYGNWVNQMEKIFKEHPQQCFIRIMQADGIVPFQWLNCPNYKNQLDDDFRSGINNKPWQKPKELMNLIR